MPGKVLHEEAGVPYVMDYRDAWLLDVFDGHQLHPDRSRAARIERRLVSSSQEIWFVNEGIRTWHAERYPDAADRMHVVMNGHDPGLAPAPRTAGPPGRSAPGLRLHRHHLAEGAAAGVRPGVVLGA